MADPSKQQQFQQSQRVANSQLQIGSNNQAMIQSTYSGGLQQNRSPSVNTQQLITQIMLLSSQNVNNGPTSSQFLNQVQRNNYQFMQNYQNQNLDQNLSQFQISQLKQGNLPQQNQKLQTQQQQPQPPVLNQTNTFSPRFPVQDQQHQQNTPLFQIKSKKLTSGRKSRTQKQSQYHVDQSSEHQVEIKDGVLSVLSTQKDKADVELADNNRSNQTVDSKSSSLATKQIRTYKEMKIRLNQLQLTGPDSLSLPSSAQDTPQAVNGKQQQFQNINSTRPLSYHQILKKEWQQLEQQVFSGQKPVIKFNLKTKIQGDTTSANLNLVAMPQNSQPQFLSTFSNPSNQQVQQSQQGGNGNNATQMPQETLKLALQQSTSEIMKKVFARSDSMNQLRQIIDLRNRRVKQKNYESQIFVQLIEKEQQRIQQENIMIAKQVLRIEDKSLIKNLQKSVKKMLKPFKGFQFDDFLHNEIHLNEIMTKEDDQKDPIKESRKRHLRILDAALKEQVVDTQVVLCICVQISRQAFFNELQDYFNCAHEFLMANQKDFTVQDIQLIIGLKFKIQKMKPYLKVSIQQNKKLDKMFYLLLEQNQDVHRQIQTYKEKYEKSQEQSFVLLSQQQLTQQKPTKVAQPDHNQFSIQTQGSSFTQQLTSQQIQPRSNSITTTMQQQFGAANQSALALTSSRQSVVLTSATQSNQKGNRNNQSQSNQQSQSKQSAQKPDQLVYQRRRIVSRATITSFNQDGFHSRDRKQIEQQQFFNNKIEEVTPPRSLVSQHQQRSKVIDIQHQSLQTSDLNSFKQKKQLQPLILSKIPKTIVQNSSKAQAITAEDRYQQPVQSEQFNIINSKKKRSNRNRRFLEPLTEQKPTSLMNKTDQGFMLFGQKNMQQSKLLPLSKVDNNADEQEELQEEQYCECVVPVAKKEFRRSTDFKLRILSKKKTTLNNQIRLVCDNCGETIRHMLHGSHSLTTVKQDKAKRNSQSNHMESGEDNDEIPNFSIDLANKNHKIGLNFELNNNNNDDDQLEMGGHTARLKDSSQSFQSDGSDYNINDKVQGVNEHRGRGKQQSINSNDDTIEEKDSIFTMVNQNFLRLISKTKSVQDFVIKNSVAKIQRFYALRHQVRKQAARLISQKVKIFLSERGMMHLKRSNLQVQRRRSAINRIADLFHSLKVKKVEILMALNKKQLYDELQQLLSSDRALLIIKAVIFIQKQWRIKYQSKFKRGRLLAKHYNSKRRLWRITREKYCGSQNAESEQLFNETMFAREQKNLEQYFWKQQVSYLSDLDQRAQMIAFRTQRDFQQSDWSYHNNTREWTSSSGILKFALEKNDQPTHQVLKEKVKEFYVSSQSPTINFVTQQLQALTDSKQALQTIYQRERLQKYYELQQQIKKCRFQKLNL